MARAFQKLEQFIGETILIMKDFYVAGETATNGLVAAFRGFGNIAADVFKALAAALPEFFTALITAGEEAAKVVGQEFVDLGNVIGDTLRRDFVGAKAAFGAMGTDAAASAARIGGAFKGMFDFSAADADAKKTADELAKIIAEGDKKIVDNARAAQVEYNKIWGITSRHGEGEGGPATPPSKQVPQMDIGGAARAAAEALKIAEAEASAEVDAFKKAATAREKLLDDQLKMHQLTMSQWQAQTVDALNDEEQDIKAAYQRELQAAGLTSSQIIEIKKKEADAIADIEQKIRDANAKAAEAEVAAWKSVADGIAGLLNSQVNGLLRGTETIGTAFKNMAASAIEALIQLGIKLAAEAALAEALSIATGGAVGGGAGGVLSGFIGSLGHFATGTPYVQNTGIALLHQGEMVTPAHLNPNNPANSLGSSGNSGGFGGAGGGDTNQSFRMGDMHIHQQPGQSGDDVVNSFFKRVRSKGVFAGNSARRYVGV